MSWPVWPKGNEKALAGYAVAETANGVRLTSSTADALAAGDLRSVVAELYDEFATMDIRWSREMYQPEQAVQEVRPPDSIVGGAGDGTCLDVALLFAGAALGKELLPVVVVLDGHALVAVSLRTLRRGADSFARSQSEGGVFTEGVLSGDGACARLAALVDRGDYVMVECTGFARSEVALDSAVPEGQQRTEGLMDFARAVTAGREQLDFAARPFVFAVDVAYLQDVVRVERYTPVGAATSQPSADLRQRHRTMLEDYDLVAGRDPELERLDDFLTEQGSGYLLVTGDPGVGKTALMAEWLRRLDSRTELRTVYYFLNRQYGTAARQFDFMQSLLQQATAAWGRTTRAVDTVAHMEADWRSLLDVSRPPSRPVVVIIDGADEADGWTINQALFPRHLPEGVHVVVTARAVVGVDWKATLGLRHAEELRLKTLGPDAAMAILERLGAPAWLREHDAFQACTVAAQGDPFYLRVIVDEVDSGTITSLDDLRQQPKGLDTYIKKWWSEVQQTAAEPPVQCLIAYLAVAMGPMTRGDLVDIDASDALTGFTFDTALEKLARYVAGDPLGTGVAFAHWRLREFISTSVLSPGERDAAETKLTAWCGRWRDHYATYALVKGVAHHLALDARAPAGQQGERRRALLEMVTDNEYQQARVDKASDAPGLVADMSHLTRIFAEASPPDVGALVVITLEFGDARARLFQPSAVFAMARVHLWREAVQRLDLLPATDLWHTAAVLCIAWAAAEAGDAEAAVLLDTDTSGSPMLSALAHRVRAVCSGAPPAVGPPAADPTTLADAQAIIARYADQESPEGYDAPFHGAAPFHDSGSPPESPEAVVSEAEIIVRAAADPAGGPGLLEEYVDLLGANPYSDYRNRSLAALLSAITEHGGAFAANEAILVVETALSPSPVRFGELLRLSMRRRELLDDPAHDWRSEQYGLMYEVDLLVGPRSRPDSSANLWSFERRRMAALAETIAGLGDVATATRLLDATTADDSGFAGFRVPAFLAIAESDVVVRPDQADHERAALERARYAAQNIRDPSFCARSTAFVNERSERAGAGRLADHQLTELVEAFVSSATRARDYPATHVVGEGFGLRRGDGHEPLDFVRDLDTLESLATSVFQTPVTVLEAANPGVTRDQRLAPGTQVGVPDTTYLPLFATWLSANLIASGMGEEEKTRAVARLVPTALANPTALDALLGRLVAVAPDVDLDQVRGVVDLGITVDPPGGREYGAMTVY